MKDVGGKTVKPTVMRCAEKRKFLAELKRLIMLVFDLENSKISLSFYRRINLKVNKFVDTFEKENLICRVKLTRREALYWKLKNRKTYDDAKSHL